MDQQSNLTVVSFKKLIVISPCTIAVPYTRKLEDSWLGPWNCLLLGERLDRGPFGHVLGKLMRDLESKLELNVNEDLLKVILGSSKDISEGKTVASQLCSKKHCYVAKVGYVDKYQPWSRLSSREAYLDADKLKQHASKLLADAFDLLEGDDREPVVLVMGYEEQVNELLMTCLS